MLILLSMFLSPLFTNPVRAPTSLGGPACIATFGDPVLRDTIAHLAAAKASLLGSPTSNVTSVLRVPTSTPAIYYGQKNVVSLGGSNNTRDSGFVQHFQNGEIYQELNHCAYFMWGNILNRFNGINGLGPLGWPTSDPVQTSDKRAVISTFTNGAIYDITGYGAVAVFGPIYAKWSDMGLQSSNTGYPLITTWPVGDGIGYYTQFQNGAIYWSHATGTHYIYGDVLDKWQSLGKTRQVGYPTSDTALSNEFDLYNTFQSGLNLSPNQTSGGSIVSVPKYGTHVMSIPTLKKWLSLGAEKSPLGSPIRDEQADLNRKGFNFTNFENGMIDHIKSEPCAPFPCPIVHSANELFGAMYHKWLDLGSGNSLIGYPISDPFNDDISSLHGLKQVFSVFPSEIGVTVINGYMVWSTVTGAHPVSGNIMFTWHDHGYEKGCLSYPSTDETVAPDGVTHIQYFIHADNPSVTGDIKWDSKTHAATFECVTPSPAAGNPTTPPSMPPGIIPPGGTKPCTQSNPCIYYFYKVEYPSQLTQSGTGCFTRADPWYANDPKGALANEIKIFSSPQVVTQLPNGNNLDQVCPSNEI